MPRPWPAVIDGDHAEARPRAARTPTPSSGPPVADKPCSSITVGRSLGGPATSRMKVVPRPGRSTAPARRDERRALTASAVEANDLDLQVRSPAPAPRSRRRRRPDGRATPGRAVNRARSPRGRRDALRSSRSGSARFRRRPRSGSRRSSRPRRPRSCPPPTISAFLSRASRWRMRASIFPCSSLAAW